MPYRIVDTGMWDKPWFERCSAQGKLLFLFLWTNKLCGQTGVYEISLDKIRKYLGFSPEKYLKELDPKIKWYPDREVVWVRNFFKRQCANSRFACAALKSSNGMPIGIKKEWLQYNAEKLMGYADELKKLKLDLHGELEKYGIDTLSIPYRYIDQIRSDQIRSDQISSEEKKKNVPSAKPSEPPKPPPPKVQLDKKTGKFRGITPERLDRWKQAFPAVEVEQELKHIAVWFMANPKKWKSNWEKTIVNWLSKEQDKGGRSPPYRGGLKGVPEDWGKK